VAGCCDRGDETPSNIKLSPSTYIAVRTVQLSALQCNTFRHIGIVFKDSRVIEGKVSKVYICHCLTVAATHLNVECELTECSTWLKVSVKLQYLQICTVASNLLVNSFIYMLYTIYIYIYLCYYIYFYLYILYIIYIYMYLLKLYCILFIYIYLFMLKYL
jgi:hypothetical protein